ncbi:endo-1,4-beta-xylanase [Streptomyces sp. GC420]|uniref:endo-1,4-beta-xylanase n=1 Tax=Streptomyces sp. GC420 TaxID=2697568 RepID=UPI001414DE53|nr:endo-1,4-beta-xylanase [Streptomyces sp. GC420]NBM18807.1 endo-1,4-beta-xylanase [Streptomyces sp. GC420]
MKRLGASGPGTLGRAAAGVLAAAVAIVGLAAPAQAAEPVLRDLAQAEGVYYGTAVTASKLTGTYGSITGTQFGSITPGNEMKWGSVEPSRGSFNWSGADAVVDFAEANGQKVRGHTLVWHSQMPGWLADGTFSDAELRTIMTDHVTTEVTRYRGRIDHWDVVNEPLNEDGTMRAGKFYNQLGESYIADAFHAARAADPGAKLYINDYNTDGTGAKSDGMYELVERLKAQGVPIDGVGFQGHLILGQVPSTLRANLQRFADLGVDVAVTELDIRMDLPATDAKLQQQKAEFKAVTAACLAVARCAGVTAWGFTDSDSWIPDVFPGQGAATPYDESFRPKRAYYGIAEALGWTGGDDPAPGACSAVYAVSNQWNTGFTANVTVTNTGSAPISGWKVEWTWPSGQSVTQAWNAAVTQSGSQVSAVDAGYNGSVGAGSAVTFGLNGSWSGSNTAPAALTCTAS